jgi:hypothetical protein
MTFDYKKYSLEQLSNWMHDAMSSGEATPQEIYDVIVGVVKENYYTYKHQASQAYELLSLLNGNGKHILGEHYEGWDEGTTSNLVCDKDDSSPECKKSWTSFWEENYYPEEYKGSTVSSVQYTEEELNAMCEKAASDEEKEQCREYNLREAEYYDKRAQLDIKETSETVTSGASVSPKVKKWVLPTEVDGLTGDVIVNLPDDLLEAANLKEGDQVEWIENGEGSYIMKKVTQPIGMEEC